ncbi:MAG: zinc ABC transporter substrate-binding protein, partial [Eubacterium sp.]|nr:zinc ABC transporter substrate-binding protein [Eubacterium sp.]
MRKGIIILLAALLMLGSLSSCGSEKKPDSAGASTKAEGGKMQIVTTIFPEYDWVMNVLGENPAGAEVTMLLDNGVDLHSFQPSAADILKISTCDLFIYIGGESDTWVKDALKEATNKNMIVINLMETLGDSVKEEEIVEGMEGHDHDHGEDADHDHEGESEHKEDADHDHEGGSEHKEDADHDHEDGH